LNGKRIYEFKNIKYESEILNGKFWNGKIYDSNNNIIDEWKEGKGFVKEYDKKGNILFEGEYINGERNGKGKEYNDYNYKLIFEGEYINGLKNGKGKEYDRYNGKLRFEGEKENLPRK